MTDENVTSYRAAVACVGAFYEKMGRMLGRAFPETVNNLLKSLKSAEVSFTSIQCFACGGSSVLVRTYVFLFSVKCITHMA